MDAIVPVNSPLVQDLVVVVDLSSSMERVPMIVRAINTFLNRIPETTRTTLLTFNSQVTVVARNVAPSKIPRFDERRWSYTMPNGHLAAGSKLRTAITRAADIAAACSLEGRSVGVVVLTDGWSTTDSGYVTLARYATSMMRTSGIPFRLFAFIEERLRVYLDRLISELKLTEEEVTVATYGGDHDRAEAAEHSVRVMSEQTVSWTRSR